MSKCFKDPLRFPHTQFVTATDIKFLNARIAGPVHSRVRNEALLNRIVGLPVAQEVSEYINDLDQLAVTLASNMIRNPVFKTGNKKTALLATGLFRLQNGMRPRAKLREPIGNDATLEALYGLSNGKLNAAEAIDICRRLWISSESCRTRKLWSNQNCSSGILARLKLFVSSKSGNYYKASAKLERKFIGPMDQKYQAIDCLVGTGSIILDKHMASLLTSKRGCSILFQRRRLYNTDPPTRYSLIFQDKHTSFNMLGLGDQRRIGHVFSDERLKYAAINPNGVSALRTSLFVSELAKIFDKALQDFDND